jgi:hypothetical protein
MKTRYFIWVLVAAIAVLVIPSLLFAVKFWAQWSSKPDAWSDYGDFVAGTSGVLLNGLGFGAILLTLGLQERVEKRVRMELEKKRIEEHLYKLLDTLADVLAGTELRKKKGGAVVAKGRSAFKNFYSLKLARIYERRVAESSDQLADREIVRASFDELYARFGSLFGHYFRTLYHCFSVIDDETISDTEKSVFASLIVCRLSKFELLMLMYNCLGSIGSRKFKDLVERYGLLEHVDTEFLLDPGHRSFFETSAFGLLHRN